MNYKIVTLIALALCLCVVLPVAAVNEYRDMNPANDVINPDSYGYAQFYVKAGGSAQDLAVYVQNVKQNLSFDSRWNPDRTDIEGQNAGWKRYEILPDGHSERTDELAAGETFEACIRNGNGNQPECQRFIVGGGDTTAVVFLGAAVSCGDEQPVCQREIVSATYGAFDEVCEDITLTHSHYLPGYHMEYRYRIGQPGNHHSCDYSHSEWSEWIDVFNTQRASPSCNQVETRWARHTERCNQVGGYADVTSNVKSVVAAGHLSFLFDNRPSPGGIFAPDGVTLLSQITDPAPGIKKIVSITYKDCNGAEQTITEDEYEVINLA